MDGLKSSRVYKHYVSVQRYVNKSVIASQLRVHEVCFFRKLLEGADIIYYLMETDSSSPERNAQDKEEIAAQLQDIKRELDNLLQEADRPSSPHAQTRTTATQPLFGNIYLFTGILFLIVFFMTAQTDSALFDLIAIVSFIIAASALIRVVADIMYTKDKSGFGILIALAATLLLTLSTLFFWNAIVKEYTTILFWLLTSILIIQTMFFVLHAYLAYMKRKARHETSVTALIVVGNILIAVATALFEHVLLYVLFVVAIILLTKASLDFAKRFQEERR